MAGELATVFAHGKQPRAPSEFENLNFNGFGCLFYNKNYFPKRKNHFEFLYNVLREILKQLKKGTRLKKGTFVQSVHFKVPSSRADFWTLLTRLTKFQEGVGTGHLKRRRAF